MYVTGYVTDQKMFSRTGFMYVRASVRVLLGKVLKACGVKLEVHLSINGKDRLSVHKCLETE